METIDATGKPCPQPVILTKKALENLSEGQIKIIVDNPISRDNVDRFVKSQGCTVEILEKGNNFHLIISKSEGCKIMDFSNPEKKNTLFYIASDQVGIGAEELGHVLMRAFIKTIKEIENKPETIIFINSGVKLTTKDSKVIGDLKEFESMDIEILSCGTCLDFYGLKDELKVGRISNMFEILSRLEKADKVIRP